jgi:hypothetical protein
MNKNKAYIITADMGYGHQRATFPLKHWADQDLINLNAETKDKAWWDNQRRSYEFISAFKQTPLLGEFLFGVMDYFQKIESFYPHRDLSKPIWQQKFFINAIEKGLGRELFDKLKAKPLPIITSFFVAVYMADYYHYPAPVYCIVCDADISRAWAPYNPKHSKVIYLVPNVRTKDRLILYGVKPNQIQVSGFPLPMENIGSPDKEIIKHDLARRIMRLDRQGLYRAKYQSLINHYLPDETMINDERAPVITFAVGGAGAQKLLASTLLTSLRSLIIKGEIELNLVAGSRSDVAQYFQQQLKLYKLTNRKNLRILYYPDKNSYFEAFNKTLRETDILWTKPSELSFYTALGIPLILSEPLGSQELFNREWLIAIGAGIDNHDPRYTHEWLPNWLATGRLARAAMQGFIEAEALGTYNIEKLVFGDKKNRQFKEIV